MNTKEIPGTFSPVGPFGDASLATWDFSRLVSAHTSGKGDMLIVSGSVVT